MRAFLPHHRMAEDQQSTLVQEKKGADLILTNHSRNSPNALDSAVLSKMLTWTEFALTIFFPHQNFSPQGMSFLKIFLSSKIYSQILPLYQGIKFP